MNRTRLVMARRPARLSEGQRITEQGAHSHIVPKPTPTVVNVHRGQSTPTITSTFTPPVIPPVRSTRQILAREPAIDPASVYPVSSIKPERAAVSYEPFTERISRSTDGRFIREAKSVIVTTQLKFIVGTVSIIAGGLVAYWHEYGERNKLTLAQTASEIGKGALSDEELVKTAEKLSLNIVHGVLNDDKIRAEVTRLLSGVVQSQPVLDSSKVLVNNLLQDPNIQQAIGRLLYDQLMVAINHPKIQESLTVLVLNVLQKDVVMDQLKLATRNLFTSEEITFTIKTVLGDAIVSEYVRQAGKLLGKDTANAIILDPTVQANLSSAIYGAITPSLFWSRKPHQPVKPVKQPVKAVTVPAAATTDREKMAERLDDRDAEGDIPEPSDF